MTVVDLAGTPSEVTRAVETHGVVRMHTANAHTGKLLRDFTADWLSDWGLAHLADSATRTVSEYTGNVVRHTDSPLIELRLTRYLRAVLIEVIDFGQPVVREPDPDELDLPDLLPELKLSKRGLTVVAAMATQAWRTRNEPGPGETRGALFEL